MDVIQSLRQKACSKHKRIVLPERDDKRVVEAYEYIKKEKIADITILTPDKIDPGKIKLYAQEYYNLRKHKGITPEEATKVVEDPLYYAAMMTRLDDADGFVAGAAHTSGDVIRAAIHCLNIDENIGTISSSFIMVVPNCPYGENGVLVYADCGVMPTPSPRQLANIAVSTAELARVVLGIKPRVAMLSYSTKGSAGGKLVENIRQATEMAKKENPDLVLDGELQVDAAIVPEVAKIKDSGSQIKGDANVLIFPNLEAGNIAYKLTQRLARARALGPILQGFNKPCSDLSRGCSVEDIVDCVAVTAIRVKA
jgi:phosphate acetyltransferase